MEKISIVNAVLSKYLRIGNNISPNIQNKKTRYTFELYVDVNSAIIQTTNINPEFLNNLYMSLIILRCKLKFYLNVGLMSAV